MSDSSFALSATTAVEVVDLRKGERIHSITGLGSPQGVAYIPELDRLFVANDNRRHLQNL